MRRLTNRTLDDALLYIQRTHLNPEQISTAMLLRFQTDLDKLDRWISDVQTAATAGENPVVLREKVAALAADLADVQRQLQEARAALDESGRTDLVGLAQQLQQDFAITDPDALYDAIAALRTPAPSAIGPDDDDPEVDEAGDEQEPVGVGQPARRKTKRAR